MFTHILSTKGLRELCPDFSKIAFVLMLFLVGFATPQMQGQIIVILEDIALNSTESLSEKMEIEDKTEYTSPVYEFFQHEVFPNPFDQELTIRVSENEGLNYLELLDENATTVWEKNVVSIPDRFTIPSLEPGTYYLKLSMIGGEYTETLIYQP